MSNEQQHGQKLECQQVEHCNLIYVVPVTRSGRNAYVLINGERHKVYPTGNDRELWTTNISLMQPF
jgi:hypothetical protein